MLDRGINDMEAGRELPLEEALNAVDRLVLGKKWNEESDAERVRDCDEKVTHYKKSLAWA